MRITLYSPLECPRCGHEFDGAWIPDATTAEQTCPACGHVFTATWKGWDLPPEQVTQRAALPYRRPDPPSAAA